MVYFSALLLTSHRIVYHNIYEKARCRVSAIGRHLYIPARESHLHGISEPVCRCLRATLLDTLRYSA